MSQGSSSKGQVVNDRALWEKSWHQLVGKESHKLELAALSLTHTSTAIPISTPLRSEGALWRDRKWWKLFRHKQKVQEKRHEAKLIITPLQLHPEVRFWEGTSTRCSAQHKQEVF